MGESEYAVLKEEVTKMNWIEKYIDVRTGCAIIILALMLIIGIAMLLINSYKCSKRYQALLEVFKNRPITKLEGKFELVTFLLKRCKTYYTAFFMWQFISKIINILCLACTFLSIGIHVNESTSQVISVLGFLCIVSQIYLNPS